MNGCNIQFRSWILGCSAVLVLSALLIVPAWAQTPNITRVEEDWEMVIGEPSIRSDSPQATCLISPVGNADGVHSTFVVNHYEVPTYEAGGLQLQAWNGETLLKSQRSPNQALLATPNEVVRWTQVMKVAPEGLVFEIINGTSTTWGSFGGDGTLKLIVPSPVTNLNAYNPDVSVEESGVSYGGNRVQSLVLKHVRAYDDAGLVAEDNNPRVVHSLERE